MTCVYIHNNDKNILVYIKNVLENIQPNNRPLSHLDNSFKLKCKYTQMEKNL